MVQFAPVNTWTMDAAIAELSRRASLLADAKTKESELELSRPLIKSEAIARIMGKDDPQKDGKKYSATAAEALVNTDEVYAMHLADQREAVRETITAGAAYEAMKFICRYITAAADVAA